MFLNRATQNIPFNEGDISDVIYQSKPHVFLDPSEITNSTSISLRKCSHKFIVKIYYNGLDRDEYNFCCTKCMASELSSPEFVVDEQANNIIDFGKIVYNSKSFCMNKYILSRTASEMIDERMKRGMTVPEIVNDINIEVSSSPEAIKVKALRVEERLMNISL